MKRMLSAFCLLASMLMNPTVTMAATKEQCKTMYSNGLHLAIMEAKCNYDKSAGRETLAKFHSNKCTELLLENEATSIDKRINSDANGLYMAKGKNWFCTENSKAISKSNGISAIAWVNPNSTSTNNNVSTNKYSQLECGKNVNCKSHEDVVSKLMDAYSAITESTDKGDQYYKNMQKENAKLCGRTISEIESWQPLFRNDPRAYQPQLQGCNQGLAKVN